MAVMLVTITEAVNVIIILIIIIVIFKMIPIIVIVRGAEILVDHKEVKGKEIKEH